jgi:NAD(P)H-hydrate repair Nnr-like enzyme with NAD(P)H-hydrate dehydratase domain
MGDIEAEPLGTAREVASHLSGIVVLKGVTTHVVTPSGLAYRHVDGVVGLATAMSEAAGRAA